jgi:hypothetical protein
MTNNTDRIVTLFDRAPTQPQQQTFSSSFRDHNTAHIPSKTSLQIPQRMSRWGSDSKNSTANPMVLCCKVGERGLRVVVVRAAGFVRLSFFMLQARSPRTDLQSEQAKEHARSTRNPVEVVSFCRIHKHEISVEERSA